MLDQFCLVARKITGDPLYVKGFAKGYNYAGQFRWLKTLQKVLEGTEFEQSSDFDNGNNDNTYILIIRSIFYI